MEVAEEEVEVEVELDVAKEEVEVEVEQLAAYLLCIRMRDSTASLISLQFPSRSLAWARSCSYLAREGRRWEVVRRRGGGDYERRRREGERRSTWP